MPIDSLVGRAPAMFFESSVPSIIHTESGEILAVNRAFETSTGYSSTEVPTMSEWIQKSCDEGSASSADEWIGRGPTTHTVDGSGRFRIRCRDGSTLLWQFYAIPLGTLPDGRHIAVAAAVDLTEQERAHREVLHKARTLETVSITNQTLLRATDERSLLQDICDIAVTQGGYRMAWVGYVGSDELQSIRHMAFSGTELGYLEEISLACGKDPQGPAVTAIRTQQPLVVPNIETHPSFVWRNQALQRGYRSLGCFPLVWSGASHGVFCVYSADLDAFPAEEVHLLETLASNLAFGIQSLRGRQANVRLTQDLAHSNTQLKERLRELTLVMGRAMEARDPYLHGHQARTMHIAVALGREMDLSEELISGIEMSSALHDIGKLMVPAEILHKPGALTSEEFALVKRHCEVGFEILKDVDLPWPVAQTVWQHHERLDGSGYPRGLRGHQMLVEARVLAVADVIDAMSSYRPYRPALTMEEIMFELTGNPVRYDPDVVHAVETIRTRGALSDRNILAALHADPRAAADPGPPARN